MQFHEAKVHYAKLRKLTTNNKTGDAYGIGIPKSIALQYQGQFFSVEASGSIILLKSGCPP